MKGYLNVGWYKRKVNGIPGLHLDLNKIAMKCIVAQGHGLSSGLASRTQIGMPEYS